MELKISLEDFPDDIYILFNDKFRSKFFKTAWKINQSYRHLARIIGISNPIMLAWRRGTKNHKEQYCPNWAIKQIIEACKNSEDWKYNYGDIEDNIKAIKAKAGKYKINNPKFPIKDCIELRKIITHIICDGYDGHKAKATAKYELTKKGAVEEFKSALSLFGDQQKLHIKEIQNNPPKNNTYQLIFSKAISKILINKFKISFEGKYARIPKELFKGKRELLIAIVRAFLIDEGDIQDRSIRLCSGNIDLLKDLRKICNKLGYQCYNITHSNRAYYLVISPNSFSKVYEDLKVFGGLPIKEKEDKMELGMAILKNKPDFKNLNNIIITELSKNNLTSLELAKITLINRKTLRERMHKLEKLSILSKEINGNKITWQLNKPI